MSELSDLIADTSERIFHDLGDPQSVINSGDGGWRTPLWSAIEEAGLSRAMVPEALGGVGIPLAVAFDILRIAGRHAVALPLAETVLAGWLLGRGGISAPDGMIAVAPTQRHSRLSIDDRGRITGRCDAVPFAGEVSHFAVLAQNGDAGCHVALLSADAVAVDAGHSIAGDDLGTVICEATEPLAAAKVDGLTQDSLMQFGAVARAMQMAGALEALLDMSVQYAQERVAFGRPISKYQAVQHNLARMAGEVAAAVAIATSAAYALEQGSELDEAVLIEAASAKIRVGEAAGEGAAIAHQVHGAIGYTMEHPLHRFAQRLWAWRDDFGGEVEWAERLGRVYASKGGLGMWPTVTAA